MSASKWISKYRSLIMELLNTHILVGFDARFSYFFFWGGGRSGVGGDFVISRRKKNFTSCIISGRVVMCFLVLTKLCFAADLSNCEDVWFQGIMRHAYKLISRLNCCQLRELLFLKKKKYLETKCCLWKLCYTAFLKLCNSLLKTSLFCPCSQVLTYLYLQVPNSLD